MGKKLDKLVSDIVQKDRFMKSLTKNGGAQQIKVVDKNLQRVEEYRAYTIDKMISEIKEEIIKEESEKIDIEKKKVLAKFKLKEANKMLILGFIIAFFVGIASNQITEILNKTIIEEKTIKDNIIIFLFTFIIISGIFLYLYFAAIKRYFND